MKTDTAFAKINLALHVRCRRADGYHELGTLFAYLDDGDRLSLEPAPGFELVEHGQFAGHTGCHDKNLVTLAAQAAGRGQRPAMKVTLDKRLPVAAGLGGGSADAAAMLRLLGAGDRYDLAASLGADVPACLASVPVIGTGTGTDLVPVVNDVSGMACLLVNPMLPLSTRDVFNQWSGVDRGPLVKGSAREVMLAGRNDLESAAVGLCPAIADVLAHLRSTGAVAVRMSGSGASCFAIYDDHDVAVHAAQTVKARAGSSWWTLVGRLR